ncbi:hypothetical protein VTK56DRAFT_6204 [Thermocarpiscus australiensis]
MIAPGCCAPAGRQTMIKAELRRAARGAALVPISGGSAPLLPLRVARKKRDEHLNIRTMTEHDFSLGGSTVIYRNLARPPTTVLRVYACRSVTPHSWFVRQQTAGRGQRVFHIILGLGLLALVVFTGQQTILKQSYPGSATRPTVSKHNTFVALPMFRPCATPGHPVMVAVTAMHAGTTPIMPP